MIGRSGSSAGSCVAASQSLRIGRWRAGAEGVCIGGGLPICRACQVCDAGAPNATVLIGGAVRARGSAASRPQTIGPFGRAAEQRGLLVGRVAGGDALERIPQHLIAAGALVDREIAFEHRALRTERADAGLDIGAPRFRGPIAT